MECGDHVSNLETENMCQRGSPRIDCSHLEPKHAQRRRHLAADEAETNPPRPPPRASRGLDPLAVFHGAQVKDAFEVGAWNPQAAIAAPGRDQYPVVRDDFAAFETNLLVLRFKLCHGSAEQEVDSELLVFGEWRN